MARQNQKRPIKVPEEVKYFSKSTYKKFKKNNKEYYDSKKEMKMAYFTEIMYDIPKVIDWLIRFSHIQTDEVKEMKSLCYEQLTGKKESPAFIKYLTKVIDDEGIEAIPNIEYMPIILHEIISDINRYNDAAKKEDPEAKVFDASELYELSNTILKKKLKKAKKKNIDENVAFDVLSIIPCEDAMKYSPYYRIKSVFEILYLHSKTKSIVFKDVIDLLLKGEYSDIVIAFALQERKEKFQKFNDSQKSFFNDISEWIFNELEDMDKKTIENIITTYVNTRKKDAEAGKDGNRRYFISSLPDTVYPKICKVVERIKNADETAEKYL